MALFNSTPKEPAKAAPPKGKAAPQKAPQQSKKKPVDSRHLAARREWNERYSDYISAANNWRLMALGSMAVAIICAVGLAVVSSQQKVVPYIVQTNERGGVMSVQPAVEKSVAGATQIKAALENWIVGARTVYVDARAQERIVMATYNMTLPDSAAYQNLAAYHREKSPYARAVNETVEVEVQPPMAISADTWQVEWTEITRQRSGKEIGRDTYQVTFTVQIRPPQDDQQIRKNATGVYVQQFAWAKRF